MNNWIYHLKDYANENNISYADAVKDHECRKQYYDNLGKKQPKKVKKIMKVEKVKKVEPVEPVVKKIMKVEKVEKVEPVEPVVKKIRKVKTEIEEGLKKVKTAKPKVLLKKNVNPADLFI